MKLTALLVAFILTLPIAFVHAFVQSDDTATAAPDYGSWTVYGDPIEVVPGRSVSVNEVYRNLGKYMDREIQLVGPVDSLCQQRGCWIRIAPSKDVEVAQGMPSDIFIKLVCPQEGWLVAKGSEGKQAVAVGKLVVEEISEADARHFAEDRGATQEEIAKIVGPQKSLSLKTAGVRVAP
jgi:hypothetical protein